MVKPTPPIPKRAASEETTHNRVYKTTSELANEVAGRWNTTKIELYRYLVELAHHGHIQLPVKEQETP